MKLKSGMCYTMRNGSMIGPMFIWDQDGMWHEIRNEGVNAYAYHADGSADSGRPEFDIVRCYVPACAF